MTLSKSIWVTSAIDQIPNYKLLFAFIVDFMCIIPNTHTHIYIYIYIYMYIYIYIYTSFEVTQISFDLCEHFPSISWEMGSISSVLPVSAIVWYAPLQSLISSNKNITWAFIDWVTKSDHSYWNFGRLFKYHFMEDNVYPEWYLCLKIFVYEDLCR